MEATDKPTSKKGMNKMLLVLGAAVVLMVLVGIGIFVLGNNGGGEETDDQEEIVMREVSADEIGLEVTRKDEENVFFDVKKLDGIAKIEGSLDYEAEDRGLQGVIVEVDVASGDYTLPKTIYLGTCSAVCTPHKVTSDITAKLKINFTNGEVGQLEQAFPLEAVE